MPDASRSFAEVVLELTDLIYAAAADVDGWLAFLDGFARAVGARRSALLLRDRDNDALSVVRWHGWPDEDIRLYLERYCADDPARSATFRASEGTVAADHEICPRATLEASPVFREFYAPRGCVHTIGGMILVTGTCQSLITSHRGPEAGPFGETEKSLLRHLLPHLKRAALLHGELGSLRRQLATFSGHLESYPYGLLLTDAERRVLYSNAAAREIAAAHDGVSVENGRFVAISSRRDAELGKAVTELAGGHSTSLLRLEIARPSRRKSYRLIVMPIGDSGTLPLGVAVPGVSILVIDSESISPPSVEVLRYLFPFTPMEARVASELVMGRNAEEIATEFGTSIETTRTHIKRIFSKTATSRQSQLISLILHSMPPRQA